MDEFRNCFEIVIDKMLKYGCMFYTAISVLIVF